MMMQTLRVSRPLLRSFRSVNWSPVSSFHSAAPTFAEKEQGENNGEVEIDRSNPLYAPSWRREWKHYGYTNIAQPKEGEDYWKEWEDLPAPYKYYHVKVDPKDVENEGLLWKVATNWKTAIPLSLGFAIPLFAYDIIVFDSHMELAAIFWSSVAMVQMNFGSTIRRSIQEENDEIKQELLDAENEYFESLEESIDVHQKAVDLPKYVKMINEGERALRHIEADAATRRVKIQEVNRMIQMLDYLVMTSKSDEADTGDDMVVTAQANAEKKLLEDKQRQQQSITDAINALKSTGVPQAGNTTEQLFKEGMKQYRENPPQPDPEQLKADKEREREIFNKRFGFTQDTVTEAMLENAKGDQAKWAVLKARVGGATPEVGMKLQAPNPINFEKK